MINLETAYHLLCQSAQLLPCERVSLAHSAGRIIAQPIIAPIARPRYPLSAMDGYAVIPPTLTIRQQFRIIGSVAMGEIPPHHPYSNECVRVFTGSILPPNCAGVIPQEDVVIKGDCIQVRASTQVAQYVRHQGADYRRGETILSAGTRIDAGCIALLAATTTKNVPVVCRPHIAILSTGSELISYDSPTIPPTAMIDSNRPMLAQLVAHWGGTVIDCNIADDTVDAVREKIAAATEQADIVIVIGGASVGADDVSQEVAQGLGCQLLFRSMSVKPGKPTWAGMLGNVVLLGLPGNPLSVYVVAHLLLKRLIAYMSGVNSSMSTMQSGILFNDSIAPQGDRDAYLIAHRQWEKDHWSVEVARRQASAFIRDLASCNCLVYRHAQAPPVKKGAQVAICPL